MALIKPFFQTIPAFDATAGTTIQMSVLGGSPISYYGYTIYNNDTSAEVTSVEIAISTDESSESIRFFPITISPYLLENNTAYNIVGYTRTAASSSPYSTPFYFKCYVTPTFTPIISNMAENIVDASTALLSITFNTGDVSSPAIFNDINITMVGISRADGSEKLLFDSGNIYDLTDVIDITGFLPNVDSGGLPVTTSLYSSYTISGTGHTTDLTPISFTLDDLNCYYAMITNEDVFTAINIPAEGRIMITSNYTPTVGTVAYIEIRRQTEGEDNWIVLQTINETDVDTNPYVFTMYDNYTATNTTYNYKLVPIDSSGNEGDSYTAQVVSCFYKSYICDATTMYEITTENQWGSKSFQQYSSVQTPYGARFPLVTFNATLQYNTGNTSALLLSSTTRNSSNIDRMSQVRLINEFNTWLANRRAKILKDLNGNIFIVSVTNAIPNVYYQELGNGIASTSFDWAEVGNFEQDYIDTLGLGENFDIIRS